MYSRVRDRYGSAALIVAIVALVAAVGGTAIAAKSPPLNGKQKKEVTKIAKKYAGKPGKAGTNGTNGANGAKGDKGDAGTPGAKGDKGDPGTNGVNGVSPIGTAFTGPKGACQSGGVEYKGATTNLVCNGETGFTEVLPSGKTETGAWSSVFEGEVLVPISFNIPLAAPLDAAHVQNNAKGYNGEDEATPEHEACPGTVENPRAGPGFLCVYAGFFDSVTTEIAAILDPSTEGPSEGAARTGAALYLSAASGVTGGTWAVTAP